MRLPVFLLAALVAPIALYSQVVPPTTDVSKAISLLTTGMTVKAITVDSTGNVYLAGSSASGFAGATQTFGPRGGETDIFVIKTNSTGDQILYAVSIGSSAGEDVRAIRADANGNLYALGSTTGNNFPTTKAFNPTNPIGAILFKLNAAGNALTYATQLSSRMTATAFDLDNTGAAYIVGASNANDIATTAGVIKPAPIAGAGQNDFYGFIVKLSATGTNFDVATYYGNIDKAVEQVSVRSNGILILANGTLALLSTGLTTQDATATPNIAPANLAFDASGNVYVAGTSTLAGGGFALRRYSSTLQQTLDKTYSLVSTTAAPRIAVAGNGRIYLFGQPTGPNFATKNATQPCMVNVARPNGAAGYLVADNGGGLIGGGGQSALPPDQAMIITDTNGEILHATFLTANVAQAATAPNNGRVYVAASQTVFSTPDWTTWRGILRFNQDIIPTEKASPSCLVQGAYYLPVPVTPGALMTIYGNHLGPAALTNFGLDNNGRVPTSLAGVSVTVDNRPAPMLFTYDKQINFIVPWATRTDGAVVPVCVTYDGSTTCLQAGTGPAAPGAFPCGSVSCALNQDYSVNWPTTATGFGPAAPGSIVSIFMTGYGTVDGALVDGGVTGGLQYLKGSLTATTEPPPTDGCGLFACATATAAAKVVEVQFAGAAPSLVAGVNQVNLKIPADMPSGLQSFTLNFTPTGSTAVYTTVVKLQIR